MRRILQAGSAAVLVAAIVMSPTAVTGAASTVTLSRAPYVTDLTTTAAYIDWAIEGSQTAGSVMVQPASGGTCPASIPWNATQAITSPTTDPLVQGTSKTVSWKVTVGATAEYQAETPVTGLAPGTKYCYAVYSTHSSSAKELWPVQSFTTLDGAGSTNSLTFDVVGDTGETLSSTGVEYPNDLNPGQQAIYQEIGASGARFLLMAGDVSYSGGTETSYGDLNQKGVDVSDIFGPAYLPQAKGTPTYVADGNHGQTNDDLRLWPEVKSVAASGGVYSYGPPPAKVDGITAGSPSDWYAIQSGQVRIYVLDAAWADAAVGTTTGALCNPVVTDCKQYQADADEHWQTTSTEYKWLANDLAAHPGGVKMALFHYPLRSITNTQPSDPYLSGLEKLLANNGVKVAFNGHAHNYQRIQPTATGTLTNFVTGGGGGILQPVDGNPDRTGACTAMKAQATVYATGWSPGATPPVGSSCDNSGTLAKPTSPMQVYNFLKVTVTGQTVTVTAINALGQTFDSATINYGGAPPPPPPPPPPPGSPAFVQAAQSSGKTVSLSAPAHTGDLLVLSSSLYTGATNHITAVTDGSDTWHQAVDAETAGHNSDGELWWTIAQGPVTAITVTTATSSVALGLQEFSGVAASPVVTVGSGSGSSTAAAASTTATGFAVGFVAGHANSEPITGAPGYVNQGQVTTPAPVASLVDGYQLGVAGSTTYGGTFGTAMYWSAGVAVFG